MLIDARGDRLTPSHAVKKGRRYRYYVSGTLITKPATDAQGWRLPARKSKRGSSGCLAEALTSPARLFARFGLAGTPSDQRRKMLDRATRCRVSAQWLPGSTSQDVRDLIEQIVVEEKRSGSGFGAVQYCDGEVAPPGHRNEPGDSTIEFTAPVAFRRRGVEIRLVLPGCGATRTTARDVIRR